MTPFSPTGRPRRRVPGCHRFCARQCLAAPAQLVSHRRHRPAARGQDGVRDLLRACAAARQTPIEAFPFFPWRERVRAVELLDIPGLARFPYAERLAELLAEPPRWPEPTEGLSGVRVRLHLAPAPRLSRLFEPRTLHLDLIDYPGEWLLDLPLLRARLRAMVGRDGGAGERRHAGGAVTRLAGTGAGARSRGDGGSFALARIGSAYVDYLKRCRAEGLSWLQPGRFLAGTTPLGQLFFPLSRARGVSANAREWRST